VRSTSIGLGCFFLLILTLGTIPVQRVAGQARPEPQLVRQDADNSAADAQPQENILALKLAQAVALGDFNGDGATDVATADFLRDVVVVRAGDAEGRFTTIASLRAGRGTRSIVARDFDQDGKLDLAVGNLLSGDVRLFHGRGDGQFSDWRTFQLAPGVSSVSGDDVDADGDADLTVANFLSGQVVVFSASGPCSRRLGARRAAVGGER
jgi:hypothetical protein